ncbi:hypothetical protein [Kaistia nematophila]|uniref:O-antigen ligase family protein n=1 Tax=Kaistia nematophila TaxID=2994654 RepID=A0A9X3E3X4_9HYPH|nr:hypothetical protein [Kaistia nematophila]MCX5570957.1 hypothetical protein [Kaistia nematophila]
MLATDALSGPIRYGLQALGLVGLSYAPFLAVAALVAAYVVTAFGSLRRDAIALAILALPAFWLPYALLLGQPPAQVAFGLYTWMPVFLGMVVVATGAAGAALRLVAFVWAVAVAGVLANLAFRFPWVGESYEIFGVQAEFAREWQAFGVDRLPGFSRASFTAANQIAIGGALLLAGAMPSARKVVVWLVSVVAIGLTTSKAPLAAMFAAPLFLLLHDRLPGRSRFRFSQFVIGGLLAVAIGLPVAALLGLRFGEGGNLAFLSFGSVVARMEEMWPRAYALLDPAWPRLLLGVGFGGIGAGQAYFDPARFSPGDNLFVFLATTFGVGALVFVVAFWRGDAALFEATPPRHRLFFLLAMLVLILGAMANVVESVLSGFLLGLVAGKALDPRAAAGEAARSLPVRRPGGPPPLVTPVRI